LRPDTAKEQPTAHAARNPFDFGFSRSAIARHESYFASGNRHAAAADLFVRHFSRNR
jgi:hypothetical protein